MNRRIREFAEQAEIWARQFEVHWGDGPDTNELFKEKFAELIVRECADLTRWTEHDMSVEQRIRLSIYQEIKSHFGVE
jgi:hypothetical protein